MSKNKLFSGVRVRFAPSPTGHLHIGGLRGALFNYVFAKQQKGLFLIRIEDTDSVRNKNEYTEAIIKSFDWCNIKSDEPLIFQSSRLDVYQKYIKILLDSGIGYYSEEESSDGFLGKVIKCRVPKEKNEIVFNDLIRGKVVFPIKEVEDFIVVRSDGTPLYNLVVVIDDIEMKISHIIRGEEHLSNTPRQLILYDAFNQVPPIFAHLPLILGSDGKKLSKRDAATAVIDYKRKGFLPEALCNYLIRLGWANKNQEIFSIDEVINCFSFSSVTSSGAMFDMQKLLWVNNIYIKQKDSLFLLNLLTKEYDLIDSSFVAKESLLRAINLYKERSNTLLELKKHIESLFHFNSDYNILIDGWKDYISPIILLIDDLIILFSNVSFSLEDLKISFNEFSKIYQIPFPILFKAIRYIILHTFESPSIYEIVIILGKKEVLNRFYSFKKNILVY